GGIRPRRARPPSCRCHDPINAGGESAEFPALVSHPCARTIQVMRCDLGTGDTLYSTENRPADVQAWRRRASCTAEHGSLYATDLVHRLAGGSGPSALTAAADWRANHRCALARRNRLADSVRA